METTRILDLLDSGLKIFPEPDSNLLKASFMTFGTVMEKIISATQARIHFGELIREAHNQPVTVEKDGKPQVVVISKQAYDELISGSLRAGWRDLLGKTHRRCQDR